MVSIYYFYRRFEFVAAKFEFLALVVDVVVFIDN